MPTPGIQAHNRRKLRKKFADLEQLNPFMLPKTLEQIQNEIRTEDLAAEIFEFTKDESETLAEDLNQVIQDTQPDEHTLILGTCDSQYLPLLLRTMLENQIDARGFHPWPFEVERARTTKHMRSLPEKMEYIGLGHPDTPTRQEIEHLELQIKYANGETLVRLLEKRQRQERARKVYDTLTGKEDYVHSEDQREKEEYQTLFGFTPSHTEIKGNHNGAAVYIRAYANAFDLLPYAKPHEKRKFKIKNPKSQALLIANTLETDHIEMKEHILPQLPTAKELKNAGIKRIIHFETATEEDRHIIQARIDNPVDLNDPKLAKRDPSESFDESIGALLHSYKQAGLKVELRLSPNMII